MIFLPIDRCDYLHCCLQQHSFHRTSDFRSFCRTLSKDDDLDGSFARLPLSVRGVAKVTSSVHCSQQTSSSFSNQVSDEAFSIGGNATRMIGIEAGTQHTPFVNHAFLRFFSKNCTAISPLTPVFLAPRSELESNCRTRAAARCSMRVEISTFSM
jgi:hypothetical protein